jgi:hypothetical protein
MKHYLIHAGIGFAICAPIGYLSTQIGWVPWAQQHADLMGAYFSISGAYLATFPAVLCDILTRRRIWANPRVRCFSVPLVGASLGLFVLGWKAILGAKGLEPFGTARFQQFLCGGGPQPLWTQARELINKAELLGTWNVIMENWAQYASVFAALAIAGVWVCDMLKSRKNAT